LIDGTLFEPGNAAGTFSHPSGMSELGDVVGSLRTGDGPARSFVWHKGTITDLGAGPAGAQFGEAISINARGEVLGLYVNQNSQQGLVLWRPVRGSSD